MSEKEHKAAFFRQSVWLMFANIGGGALMFGVHFLAKVIPKQEYASVGALLAVTILIPTLPLQMVFAQQTAAALATGRERQLASMVRKSCLGLFLVWFIAAVVVFVFRNEIVSHWKLTNTASLWATLAMGLGALWMPVFYGVLQGQQNFLWMGWAMISNAIGRFGSSLLIVLALGGLAAGMMTGAALGGGLAMLIAIWQTRKIWSGPSEPFNIRALLAQIVPLILGFIACQFFFTADTMFVNAYFTGDDTAGYVAAGTLSRALQWMVLPLATVMFPKIVHSVARSEKSDLMAMTLAGTAALAIVGALGLWILGPWIVKIVFKSSYIGTATSVLPWYAFGMIPLCLGNVLASNLLARSQFRIVPFLVVLAAGYGLALWQFHDSLVLVLKIFGVFNLALLAICAWFTWHGKQRAEIIPAS